MQGVSTHAPLAGSDRWLPSPLRARTCFNPRSPCGERPYNLMFDMQPLMFQPTLPLRGATFTQVAKQVYFGLFQPTLPLRGATNLSTETTSQTTQFQPTLPLRGATRQSRRYWHPSCFNPRSPCGERLLHLVNVALRAYHMHDVFHPNASSDELRPSEANQKAVRTSQGIPDSPQFAPPIIPTAYS